MNEEVEFDSLKALYDTVAGPNSASYEVFRKKWHKLLNGNVRTTNRMLRNQGIEVKRPKEPSREFVSYDGEGWEGKYTLLANSEKEWISNPEGLSTKECLEFLAGKFDVPRYRVFFAFSYDVNNIIRDFDDEQLTTLLRGDAVIYEGIRVRYTPGKIFEVNHYRYFDVFGFFQTSFVKVVGMMLGAGRVTDSLKEGKNARGTFETWGMDKIIAYNAEELELLVEIMDKLKLALLNIGVNLRLWYGPGAIAKYWFRQHNVIVGEKLNESIYRALSSAYYGGRFEQIVLGKVSNVYEYDIHSAYPSVMAIMPHFRSWTRTKEYAPNDPYAIYEITFDLRANQKLVPRYKTSARPHTFLPLPVRSHDGRICFPVVGRGWYWQSEIQVMLDYFKDAKLTFHDGYRASTEGRPFGWVKDLYDYRRKLKADGNLSQYAIKVGLNSLYGKTAQRVGRAPYFSLAWAGYITSTTRAKLARAGYEAGSEHILGFATDALFSDKPLTVPLTDNLGDWEESKLSSVIFFQSGIYRLFWPNGKIEDRYRGAPSRRGIDLIIEQLKMFPNKYPRVKLVRFISNILAVHAEKTYGPVRLQFVSVSQELAIDAPYKRHYQGFRTGLHNDGTSDNDYGRLLTHRIDSLPKVFVEDNHWLISEAYLNDDLPLGNIKTSPKPILDRDMQMLLEEAEFLEGYDAIESVAIPIMEDDMG